MLNNSTLSFTRISSLCCWIALLIVVHTVIAQYIAISIFSPQRSTTSAAVAINHHIDYNATAFQNVVFLEALQFRLTAGSAVNLTLGHNLTYTNLERDSFLTGYASLPIQINHYLLYNIS